MNRIAPQWDSLGEVGHRMTRRDQLIVEHGAVIVGDHDGEIASILLTLVFDRSQREPITVPTKPIHYVLLSDLALVCAHLGRVDPVQAQRVSHVRVMAEIPHDMQGIAVNNRYYVGLRSEEHTSELQSHVNLVC